MLSIFICYVYSRCGLPQLQQLHIACVQLFFFSMIISKTNVTAVKVSHSIRIAFASLMFERNKLQEA